jgi:ArsR family transcriptional regulator, arsenate/arsenite/antimonite-responsive transcriptional repressor / arsenate reductase (thioredoxin)
MNTEESAVTADLAARAARHAALADVTRLLVMDLLSVGDRSPRELQEELGLASNLLAHHLAVLERVGLILRRRSEADRRRSYVQLVRGAAAPSPPPSAGRSGRDVVFVCTANSARSQLAAALWNTRSGQASTATSAGTHPADRIAPRAVAAGRRRGIELSGRPRRLSDTQAVAGAGESLLITVCDRAHEELARRAVGSRSDLHWSVPDPVQVDTDAAFEATLDELEARISVLTDAPAPPTLPSLPTLPTT